MARGGAFRFINGHPRRPAHWRTLTVTQALEGSPLFQADESGTGFLKVGDVPDLLWDIEQAYPAMKV